jgi:hypothetical protein
MTLPTESEKIRPKRRGLALLWALPLALVVGLASWIPTGIALCGVSGCSGGGFGVSWNPFAGFIGLVIGGAIVALPLVLVRWTISRGLRLAVGAAAGLVFATAGWLYLWPAVDPTR